MNSSTLEFEGGCREQTFLVVDNTRIF